MTWSSQLESLCYIVIALTGLIGNTTTIIIFSQRRLRSLRSSFFLTCLAITDLIFILILVIVFLHRLNVPVMTTPVCMLTIYLSHIASFLSSNFTLAYTLHRLIAVFFPIKATTFLKQRTNRIVAFALFIFACSFYSLSFPVTTTKLVSNTTNVVDCEEDRGKPLLFPFLVLDTLFTFIIPFSCIACMNLAIVYKLHSNFSLKQSMPISNASAPALCPSAKASTNSSCQSQTEAMELQKLNNNNNNATKTNSQSSNANYTTQSKINHHRLRQQNHLFICDRPMERRKRSRNSGSLTSITSTRNVSLYHKNTSIRISSTQCRATASAKTTKMLLAASTVFLVFNLPYHSLLFCFLFTREQPSWMAHAVNIARLWFFASFCVNFFVYVICGQRFRREVVRLFSCTILRRYFTSHSQAKTQERQNSICLGHRLFRAESPHASHSN
ncbi:unnamed protein product [Rotaria socialis]|uniref:G-protein coupled receptors family 1 profile domain-containing protein n=1 Tax=Rotaria socialis TaxID=392032 RepID=A0A821W997_9BILA|nr:unnamed protein product [Rotaria socialis]CAF4920558.1 unnamed protein product [Rotaria socialis]